MKIKSNNLAPQKTPVIATVPLHLTLWFATYVDEIGINNALPNI